MQPCVCHKSEQARGVPTLRYCRSKILPQPTKSTEAIRLSLPARPRTQTDDSYKHRSESSLPVNPFRYVRSVLSAVDDVLTFSLDITGYYDLCLPLFSNEIKRHSRCVGIIADRRNHCNPRHTTERTLLNFLLCSAARTEHLLGHGIRLIPLYCTRFASAVLQRNKRNCCLETGTFVIETVGPGNFDRVSLIDNQRERPSTEPKMARTNVAVGLNKGFPTTAIPKAVKPSHKKGIKT